MKTIRDIDIKDKTVLVRVDYNVPLKNGAVESDFRIRASLPTLNYLRDHGAKQIFLISHLGRPEGPDAKFSLAPVAKTLNNLIGNVTFIPDFTSLDNSNQKATKTPAPIFLLENLRFFPGEKSNDPAFIKQIIDATHPDFYVQDGFAVVHRAHASTDAVKNFLPIYAGLLLEKELKNLKNATENPEKPLLLILGGAKVEDKAPLIVKFQNQADQIVIGGKIAADGYNSTAKNIYVAEDFDEDSKGDKLDVGPISMTKIANSITDANTIIWNGLLGYAEDPAYATASTITAELMGEKQGATTIVCGGDTTAFVEELMREHENLQYSLVSTGGGAALEYLLNGENLPGIQAIEK
ncbi:phosphoglycerate kinase [Candidatus Saccharibacteria bacterium]|nr:phosphoglycerate kinase [Candidatus Saccharibacteria bacterium]